jgi:DNA topoisomerase-1
VLTFPGYLAVYREGADNGEEEDDDDRSLPAGLAEGLAAALEDLTGEQHFTKPPPRFTEASLVKELEADGIGRPSTYAQIISVLLDRKYTERENKSLVPTELGRKVNDLLVDLFPDIFQVAFTARLEEELDKVESGQHTFEEVLRNFYAPFSQDLEAATGKVKEIKKDLQEKTGEACPECGKPLVVKWGRRGRFIACSGFPDCTFTRPLEEEEQQEAPEGVVCPDCGAPMVVKNGRFGRCARGRSPSCWVWPARSAASRWPRSARARGAPFSPAPGTLSASSRPGTSRWTPGAPRATIRS